MTLQSLPRMLTIPVELVHTSYMALPKEKEHTNLTATQNLLHPEVAYHLDLNREASNISFMNH